MSASFEDIEGDRMDFIRLIASSEGLFDIFQLALYDRHVRSYEL
jgi:hypothetical protein